MPGSPIVIHECDTVTIERALTRSPYHKAQFLVGFKSYGAEIQAG